jgi:transposase
MLTVTDRGQQGFFEASWCANLLPGGSIYSLLSEHGHRIVSDEDFADCYAERAGRPSSPPSLLAKVMLLAYRDGLSDERAMDALRFDLRWKIALDLPIDHPGFHATSLVRFRARLLLHGRERLVFERSLELAKELGLIEEPTEQIVDSTPLLGAAAVQDTVSLVRSGVRKLLDAVKSCDQQAAGELESGLRFDYARPSEKPDGDWSDREARQALLSDVATDAERALQAVEREDELASEEAVAEAAKLLREIVGQEFEVSDDEVPRVRRGRRTRQVLSAHDPEMRHGRKTAAKPFTGYKLHAAAAAEAPLLTSICVSPGSEHDGQHAATLIDQEPEERRPERVIGDTAYGNVETREQLEDRSVEVLAPVDTTSPKDGTFPKDAFAIDLEAGTVTCPRGETARMQRPDPRGERLARFSAQGMRAMPAQRAVCARRSADDPHQPPRGSPPGGDARATRSRRARAPLPRPTPHRAPARADRPSLPRAAGSLLRSSKSDAAGRVDGGVGQSAPDWGRPARRGSLRGAVASRNAAKSATVGRPRPGAECATRSRLSQRSRR